MKPRALASLVGIAGAAALSAAPAPARAGGFGIRGRGTNNIFTLSLEAQL